MQKYALALGFFQEPQTAKLVLAQLKIENFTRIASISCKKKGEYEIYHPFSFFPVNKECIKRFQKCTFPEEILILVEVKQQEIRQVLEILRQVTSGHPATFLLRPPLFELDTIKISTRSLSQEALADEAEKLAQILKETRVDYQDLNLRARFQKSETRIQLLRKSMADAEYIEQSIPPSGQWLLDNMYVIEGGIEEVKLNLPKKFYQELPKLMSGPYKGFPRVYRIALELLANTNGILSEEVMTTFLESYQKEDLLTIGELWAFPLMLRIRLIEMIEYLADRFDNRMRDGELARFWGNRFLSAKHHDESQIPLLLASIANEVPFISPHFAEELIDHLFDEERLLPSVRQFLENYFKSPLEPILHQDHLDETLELTVFSNAIKSLITLSQISWQNLFEKVSLVETILRQDPEMAYSNMDFVTRNAYRTVIETMARKIKLSESEVARKAIAMASCGEKAYSRHVGYYLIDQGRAAFNLEMGYEPPFLEKISNFIIKNSKWIYLGGIASLIVFLWVLFHPPTLLFFLLSLIPFSEISIQIWNYLITQLVPTHLRPRMSFKQGVGEENKTLVVIPTILTLNSLKNEINALEIRYLANSDPAIQFSIFNDLCDAKEESREEDSLLLNLAKNEIEALDKKYGAGKFFLFSRKRVWSESEQVWMGWERKRGKLECLNRFLMGENLAENILYAGEKQNLQAVRYIITLDADTKLPKDQAKALIEVIAHPLNRPYLSSNKREIERGFTIIQPRVATDFLEAKKTWFSQIFSDQAPVDPYTKAITNVYQDLTQEGSYHGKGIYDLACFYTLLSDRFPSNHLLSHDLIEGAFTRVGFASDICLFDSSPDSGSAWLQREHRWIRGDLQIFDWLKKWVPTSHGKEKNSLSWINKWKIFDNLRRSLLSLSLIALLIFSWYYSYFSGVLIVAFVLFYPLLFLPIKLIKNCSSFREIKISVYRLFINAAFLPIQAIVSLDAWVRVAFRRLVSKRHLLEWKRSGEVGLQGTHSKSWILLGLNFVIGMICLALGGYLALGFSLLWILSPLLAYLLDSPISYAVKDELTVNDEKFLRKIARKTWRFFDDLVGPSTHFMPPDNYQTALNVEIAARTSPTNTGMWLLSLLSAHDFKYITHDVLIDKAFDTLLELKKLERYEGHFLNWYDITNLNPLFPRYISAVDSGNLLASFWTLKQGLENLYTSQLLPNDFRGILDSFQMISEKKSRELMNHFSGEFNPPQFYEKLKTGLQKIKTIELDGEDGYWLKEIQKELEDWELIILRYLPWLDQESINWNPSLKDLIDKQFSQDNKLIKNLFDKASWFAGEKSAKIRECIALIDQFSDEMNMQFLYQPDRKLFSIGYNIDEKRCDSSCYDLLASESRILSLVSIAKEDAPLEHWWALGRSYSEVRGEKVLLSWGGTMFEYLMPLIFSKQYPDSLLGDACLKAVACQIEYGNARGIPWGISESAFSAIDSHKIYQYKSFGVPGLGMKRGLEEDLVVSPYSTVLAINVNPKAALKNLKRLVYHHMLDAYGYYESVDYTRQAHPSGMRGITVYVYMAHHQGMILSTINNALNQDSLIKRFHQDPRIAGVESLLYEKIPITTSIKTSGIKTNVIHPRIKPVSSMPIMGVAKTPESIIPKLNLQGNENYFLMVTNAGGGYSRYRDIEIYRFRADTTSDSYGSFIYIKNKQSKKVWSAAFQPTLTQASEYSVSFKGDKSEFHRKDGDIETSLEIVVTPEDNAEVRLMTLVNHSSETQELEITSYLELSLAPHLTDRAHPCFNKLFIELEALSETPSLIATRRQRSIHETPIFAIHILATPNDVTGETQYETNRERFIGRNGSQQFPIAMNQSLSNQADASLDPIFSLRKCLKIMPGRRVQLAFITAASDSRQEALALVEKYKNFDASAHAIELAWTYTQLEFRHLRIHSEEVQLFQKLASRLIYPHIQLRSADRLLRNKLGQSSLWAQGISGDLPIVVGAIRDAYDMDLVKQLLIAHTFWAMRGLKVDLVILNEEEIGYLQPLQESLAALIHAYAYRGQIDTAGGVYLKSMANIPKDELNLILATARAVLLGSRGALREQLVSPKLKRTLSKKFVAVKTGEESSSAPLSFMELSDFNGLGGFTEDGKSYVIYLGEGSYTPAPWINVMANPCFGMQVSESGLGCTWYGNSQTNRLTPWSNDPLLNPISDALYIRDEESGRFWTPTPKPIREKDAYRITHSQGHTKFEHNSHGIEQHLLVFVPNDGKEGLPLRVQRLRLVNRSSQKRRLSVTSYSEWVLGGDREETGIHIVTSWDAINESLFATNRYNLNYGDYVAFSSVNVPVASFTADRTEFLGRNRSSEKPEGMTRISFSNDVGAGMDPCAALQVIVELAPSEEKEIIFTLGYAENMDQARIWIQECKKTDHIDRLFNETEQFWNGIAQSVEVKLPDKSMNYFMNKWLIYQTLSCRFWGRSGFYQSSGAYGFRDQLQDVMALVYSLPDVARSYILKATSRQFVEGDVQHWWHPTTGAGVRTRCSDDLLWLPFVTAHYIRVTNDASILDEEIAFIEADLLQEHQEEVYQTPKISKETASVFEHCKRAIDKGVTKGSHGLALIGSCDWNDGLNRVGIEGKGESVWLSWFIIQVMQDFAGILELKGDQNSANHFREDAKRLAEVIEKTSWDGAWYRRAYFDDGTPIGSKDSFEAKIDSLSQSWAVISRQGDLKRCEMALNSADKHLVKKDLQIVLLLTPPFNKISHDPGYIKAYPPGVRENGGQYTHGSSWLAMAFARMGNGSKAFELLKMMMPTVHTNELKAVNLYRLEPYVIAADIYSHEKEAGRGGWSWYTGSSSWVYRIMLEEILGFQLRGATLRLNPVLPKEWEYFSMNYQYKSSRYQIEVKKGSSDASFSVSLDNQLLSSLDVPLVDDAKEHQIVVLINK